MKLIFELTQDRAACLEQAINERNSKASSTMQIAFRRLRQIQLGGEGEVVVQEVELIGNEVSLSPTVFFNLSWDASTFFEPHILQKLIVRRKAALQQ